ncbi:unnamed protein product [Symbiodinium sp. KB8]|nr:unnamed protein product [Symbiodinium sp. KB8]
MSSAEMNFMRSWALLLAAIDIQLQRVRSLPVEKRPPQREALRRRRASILQGGIQAEVVSSHWEGVRKELLERHVIVMKGSWLQGNTRSFFLLTGADLLVFERLDSQPHKVQLSLLGSTARLEESHMKTADGPAVQSGPGRRDFGHWGVEAFAGTILVCKFQGRAWDVLVSCNKIWWERHALLAQCSQAFASMAVDDLLRCGFAGLPRAVLGRSTEPEAKLQLRRKLLGLGSCHKRRYDAELLSLREKAISWLQRRARDLMRSDAGLSAAAKSAGRRAGPPLGHVRLQRCIPLVVAAMLADQYRDFMEATTGAVVPSMNLRAPRKSAELRRSTAASAAKVQQMEVPNNASRRRAMLEAVAGMNESETGGGPAGAGGEAAAALQMCSAAAMAMPQLQVPKPGWGLQGGPLLQDAVRLSGGENLILQRVLAASSAPTSESAHAFSLRSAVTTGRSFLDATLPPMPCW